MQALRYVVLGGGGIAHYHAMGFNAQPEVSLVGVLDNNPAALQKWKAQYPQAEMETDVARLLAKTKPDIATVCSPNLMHVRLTKAALAAGCHVLCEKPMAMTLAEAQDMEKARVKAKKLGAINFSYRNVGGFRFARELIRSGELGKIQRLNVRYLQSFQATATGYSWRNDIKVAGFGAMGDLGVHMLDGAGFVTGLTPARLVGCVQTLVGSKPDAQGKLRRTTTDTNASFLIEYENGALGTFETNQCVPGYGNFFHIEASGDKGVLRICSEDNDTITLFYGSTLTKYGTWGRENFPKVTLPTGFADGQPKSTMESFVKAVRGEKVEYATFADGIVAQQCLTALQASIRTGSWTKL